ncbi:MAG: DUF4197 domain-containing protein [Burkholderiaceae bacterium]
MSTSGRPSPPIPFALCASPASRRRALGRVLAVGMAVAAAGLPAGTRAAAGLDAFTNADAAAALRQALDKGASAAVAQLGAAGGFLRDEKVRIPLPDGLRQGEKLLRLAGRGDDLDRLVETMNRAAEMAVAQARPLLIDAVRRLSVQDAKAILTGGEDAVTEYFKARTHEPLTAKFLPIVEQNVGKLGLARQYNALADKAGTIGLVKGDAASVQQYVTAKALDGLYRVLAEQERQIRQDPLATGSKLIGRVFGAMR